MLGSAWLHAACHVHLDPLPRSRPLTLANGALDVAHDEAVLIVQELHAHLGHLQTREKKQCAQNSLSRKLMDAWSP